MTQSIQEKERAFFARLKDALKRSKDLPKNCLN
jgi:hypothetical protein